VDDLSLVQILESFGDGPKKLLCLWLLQAMLRFREEIVVEGIGAAILLDEEDLGGALDDIDEFGDDWVV
jgi:hypothetical protein